MNPKFKVGDRVRAIKSYDSNSHIAGKIGTDITVDDNTCAPFGVQFDENIKGHDCFDNGKDGYCWWCSPEVLESADEITIKRYGNKVVAKCGRKVGVAKCSPEDEFNFNLGAKIAFCRLMGITIEDGFDWKKFKAGTLYVKCTKDNFSEFVIEAKKHGCTFEGNEKFNPFNELGDVFMRAIVHTDKTYVGNNNVFILSEDNSLKISHINPDGYDVITW